MRALDEFVTRLFNRLRAKPRVAVTELVGHTKPCSARGGSCGGTLQCAQCRRLVGLCELGDDELPNHCTPCWWEERQKHEKDHRTAVIDECPFCQGAA